MSSFIYLLTKSKLLLILLGGSLLLLLILGLFSSGGGVITPPASTRPSPTILRALPNFPTAQPQEFNNQTSNQTGSLAVNSNVESVTVTIDSEELTSPDSFAPENKTPFVIEKIPAGKHTLRAFKLGFLNQTIFVEIKPNEISQINLQLLADPDFSSLEAAIKEMPVSTEEYLIEYLDKIGKIQVIIRKAPFDTYKQQAVTWFKNRGIENPEASGILFYPAMNIY